MTNLTVIDCLSQGNMPVPAHANQEPLYAVPIFTDAARVIAAWIAAIDFWQRTEREVSSLREQLADSWRWTRIDPPYPALMNEECANALMDLARSHLGINGAVAPVSDAAFEGKPRCDRREEDFNPVCVWNALVNEFGGKTRKQRVLKDIRRRLDIYLSRKPPRITARWVRIDFGYMRPCEHQPWRYGYDSERNLNERLSALGDFIRCDGGLGPDLTSHALSALTPRSADMDPIWKGQPKFPVAEGICVVAQKEKTVLEFSMVAFERFQVFMGLNA